MYDYIIPYTGEVGSKELIALPTEETLIAVPDLEILESWAPTYRLLAL